MKRRIFGVVLLAVVQCIAYGQNPVRMTLKQCVETAINNNLQVQQADIQMQAAGVNLKQSKNNQLPDLFANLNHGMNQGRSIDPFTNSYVNQQINFASYSINSTVVLFNGLQQRNTIKQNQLTYEANKMDLQQTKDNITLNVILAYLQVLNNEELLQQARNQAEVTRRQVDRLRILNESGAVAPATYYDLRGQLATDELTIVNSQNNLNTARLTLAQLMNVPYNASLKVEKVMTDTIPAMYGNDPKALYETSMKQLALVKAADLRIKSAQKSVLVAKGFYYPTVGLSGSFNTNYSSAARRDIITNTTESPSGDYVDVGGSKVPVITTKTNFSSEKITFSDQFNNNYNTSVYLSVAVPIFNRFSAKNRVALAKLDLKNAQINAKTIKTQLNQNIEQAYFNMTAALDRYKTLQQQVADFTESFRTAEVRFNAGAITQVDYLITKNNVDRSRINLITAKYDYLLRRKILDYYQSTLSLD